jgi:predicted Fe-Mo cluster-binding NifX family protein
LAEEEKMKVAISSTGKDLSSTVSEVFGRCNYFLIVDIQENKVTGFEAIENKTSGQKGSIGVTTAQIVADKGVDSVITGNMGPIALDVMKQFNIHVYFGEGIVKEAIEDFIKGNKKELGV